MGKKKFLVIIDTQNDFIDGSLANPEAQRKVDNIVKKIDEFDGDTIYVTKDTHDENYMSSNEGKKLPVEHCIRGTKGWELNEKVYDAIDRKVMKNQDRQIVKVFEKPTFGSNTLAKTISADIGEDTAEIEFVGFCTDICVVSNALMVKALTYDRAEISVDAACCAGVTIESHKAALTTMKMCQINILNEDE